MKTIFYSFATLIRKISFSPLEDKIHIFAALYITSVDSFLPITYMFFSEMQVYYLITLFMICIVS